MILSPAALFVLPGVALCLTFNYLLVLEPNFVSEEILLFFVAFFFFLFGIGLFSGSSTTSSSFKTFSPHEFMVLNYGEFGYEFPRSQLSFDWNWHPIHRSDLFNLALWTQTPKSALNYKVKFFFSFLYRLVRLVLPCELDIWRARRLWLFGLYTNWSELYGFFLTCNFNMFPYFTVPPDYRRIRTWRGRRLL